MTSTTATAYPPPLSEAPSVGTLRELLGALQSGIYQVPPVPPLPEAPATAAGRPAPATTTWRVEHLATGVPVQLRIGDPLDAAQLARLRDLLRLLGQLPPPDPADRVEAPTELGFTATDRRLGAVVGAAGLRTALRALGLRLP